jgi:peptidoglycan/xylan/chitin deacetylase (PgdA/CDA1 family)
MMRVTLLLAITASLFAIAVDASPAKNEPRREVAITFDDLPGVQVPRGHCGHRFLLALNRDLVDTLVAHRIPALGLVTGSRLCDDRPGALEELLVIWAAAGFDLGNHSFSHFDLNDTPPATYETDVIRGEAAIKRVLEKRGKRLVYFRHPYLHAGKDIATKKSFDAFLARRGYRVAPVTIDNQEWVFAAVYAQALRRGEKATLKRVGMAYVAYMEEVFAFFESLSIAVAGYEIRQILLLHANSLNADYLEDLLAMMKRRGYRFISIGEALEDPAYRLSDTYVGEEGLSWLHRWGMGKGMARKQEPREPEWLRRMME